jgi:fructose-specific phosphotransferase system component IIB
MQNIRVDNCKSNIIENKDNQIKNYKTNDIEQLGRINIQARIEDINNIFDAIVASINNEIEQVDSDSDHQSEEDSDVD